MATFLQVVRELDGEAFPSPLTKHISWRICIHLQAQGLNRLLQVSRGVYLVPKDTAQGLLDIFKVLASERREEDYQSSQ